MTAAGVGRLGDDAKFSSLTLSGTTPDALDVAGARLVAGFWPQGLVAEFDLAGRLVWTVPLPAEIASPHGLFVAGNRLVILDDNEPALVLLERETGRLLDRRRLAAIDEFNDFTLVHSLVFAVGADLVAFTLDGLEVRRWEATDLGCFDSIKAVAGDAGTLLVGCDTGEVLRFDPAASTITSLGLSNAPLVALAVSDADELIFRDGFESIEILTLVSPANGAVLNTPNVRLQGTVRDDAIGLTIDGVPADITGGVFDISVMLTEGANAFLLEATTSGGILASLQVLLTLDTIAPEALNIDFVDASPPQGGLTTVSGFMASVEGSVSVVITNDRTGHKITVQADGQGRFSGKLGAIEEDTLMLVARDAAGNQSPPRQVTVPGVNDPPALDPIGPRNVELGSTLVFSVTAADPDGDALFLAAHPMPAGASLDAISGAFRFRPAAGQTGNFTIEFTASDGELTDTETITITVNLTPLGTTRLSGRILDTTDFIGGTETPVVGVAASMLGAAVQAVSGADGGFAIDDIPSGATILDLDPSTAQPAPDGSGYAGFRETIEIIPDVNNVIERPLLLPRIAGSSQQLVDPNALTIIRNDAIGVRIEIPPHTAKAPDGSDYAGPMSISQVPDNQAPASLPEELGFGLLITIQPVGVYFDQPVPIFFPNADGWPEGAEVDLWSLDANTGQFGVVGTARVISNELRTVSGGVLAADWHGFLARQFTLILEDPDGCDVCRRLKLLTGSETVVGSGALRQRHKLATYRALERDIGLELTYNSQEASPQPFIRSQVPIPLLKPGRIATRLTINGIEGNETWFDTSGLQSGERLEVAGQADAAMLPSGIYPFKFQADAVFQFSSTGSTSRGRLVVVNESTSPFGAGWTLDGLEQVREQTDGSLLWQRGGGTARAFRALRAGTGRYRAAQALIPQPDKRVLVAHNPMIADFNGDGQNDLAFSYGASSQVFSSDDHIDIRLSLGNGEFSRIKIELPSIPNSSVAADLDNDGDTDIAVCGIDFIDIVVNDGTASFSAPIRINTNNISGCQSIIAGDINGDGLPELIYPDQAGAVDRIGLMVAQGGLTWSPPIDLFAENSPRSLALADLDNDGALDLAAANWDSDSVSVFLNDGLGTFGQATHFTTSQRPRGLAVADIDGDNTPDLITADNNSGAVVVLFNDGTGTFTGATSTNVSLNPVDVAVGDLDNDGSIDIAVAEAGDSGVSVLLNNGFGGFSRRQQFFTSDVPRNLRIGDLDGDGFGDLAFKPTSTASDIVSWLRNNGSGEFEDADIVQSTGTTGRDLAVADFDGDLIQDVAIGIDNNGQAEIHFGSGNGFRAPPLGVFFASAEHSLNNGGALGAADLDIDGDPDLITVEIDSVPFDLIAVLNNGDGTFSDGAGNAITTPLPGRPLDLEVGDLNGDSRPDVLVAHRNGSAQELTPFFGLGNGQFVQGLSVSADDGTPRRVVLEDLDNDEDLDAAVLSQTDNVTVLRNNGLGVFTHAGVQTLPSGIAKELIAGDLDGDGNADVLATLEDMPGPRTLQILTGSGTATLSPPAPGPVVCGRFGKPGDIVVSDLDNDRDLDVMVSCTGAAVVEVFLNDGFGNLARAPALALAFGLAGGDSPDGIALGDFNRDGAPDLLASIGVGVQFAAGLPADTITGYLSPVGEFSRLVKNADGSFTRTEVDGPVHEFDAAGLETNRTDRNGNQFSFGYDGSARLVSVVDPVGNATTLAYDGQHLSTITGPAGRVTQFQHDADGNLTRITDPDGSQRHFNYDARHRMLSHTDKRGGLTRYEYDANGFQTRVIRADGSVNIFRPGRARLLSRPLDGVGTPANPLPPVPENTLFTERVDGRGQTWRYRTNSRGAMEERIDPLGHTRTVVRDGNNLPIREIDEAGVVTVFGYDGNGRPTSWSEAVRLPEERTRRNILGAFGLPVETIDAAGGRTIIERDASGNIMRIVDAAGSETLIVSNASGLPTAITDRNGNLTQFTYDADSNLETVINAGGVVTRVLRDAAGNITRVIEAEGTPLQRASDTAYDALNRVTSSTDALGNLFTARYDAAGNPTQFDRPGRDPMTLDYDERDRIVELGGSATPQTTEYDGNGQVLRQRDAAGAAEEFLYDAAGRMIAQLGPLGRDYQFEYDTRGYLTRLVDARGRETTFAYDALGRNILQTNALDGSRIFDYDALDNIVRLTQLDGTQIGFTYDALSRVIEMSAPGDTRIYGYDPEGNLISAADTDSTVALAYDSLNRLIETSTTALGAQPTTALTFAWDSLNRRISRQDNLGGLETYEYDLADRMTQLTPAAGAAISFMHDAMGAVTHIDFPNGVTSAFTFNGKDSLIEAAHHLGATQLVTSLYSFDEREMLAQRTDNGTVTDFTYDELKQVTSAAGGRTENYTYDLNGNRISSHFSASHVVDAGNRLLQDDDFDYVYDPNGQLQSRTARAHGTVRDYTYDHFGRLIRIDLEGGGFAEYAYDALARRIRKNVNGVVTQYVYDGEDIALEFDGAGIIQARYSQGESRDTPVAQVRDGTPFYYQRGQLGHVRLLTDAGGAVVNQYDYDSYGNPTVELEAVANPYRYTGREWDAESGHYYYRARYYDPQSGRFLSEDPLGFLSGDANFFRYVANNPLNFTDPSGKALASKEDFAELVISIALTKAPPISGANVLTIRDAVDTALDQLSSQMANLDNLQADREVNGPLAASQKVQDAFQQAFNEAERTFAACSNANLDPFELELRKLLARRIIRANLLNIPVTDKNGDGFPDDPTNPPGFFTGDRQIKALRDLKSLANKIAEDVIK